MSAPSLSGGQPRQRLPWWEVQRARMMLYAAEGMQYIDIARGWTAIREVVSELGRLVEQVMAAEPYASARTVYWIVDNGSSHAGKTSTRYSRGSTATNRSSPAA